MDRFFIRKTQSLRYYSALEANSVRTDLERQPLGVERVGARRVDARLERGGCTHVLEEEEWPKSHRVYCIRKTKL
jgi:hypothetical protein